MKIGIFGDSYACVHSSRFPKKHNDTPWMTLLENPDRKITNFGISGSSVYWSYMNYKKNYTKFDKNIFLATSTGRIFIPWNKERLHWTIASVMHEIHRESIKHITDFNTVYDYFTKIYNTDEHQTYKELMIKDIIVDNNTLVIDNTDILFKMSLREIDYYKSLKLNLPYHNDNRFCHVSQEANNFLAERLNLWIETGIFDITDWKERCPLPAKEKAFSYFLENF